MWQKILPYCKQFLFFNSGQIDLPLPVDRNGLHCLLQCQAARLTKIVIALSVRIYIYSSECIFGDLTDFPTLEAEKWKTIHGSLVRERGFHKQMKREFLMRDVLLPHFYS